MSAWKIPGVRACMSFFGAVQSAMSAMKGFAMSFFSQTTVSVPQRRRLSRADVLLFLRAWRSALAQREHWTRGAVAVDRRGEVCAFDSADAVAWCVSGAAKRVSCQFPAIGVVRFIAQRVFLSVVADDNEYYSKPPLVSWNDTPGRQHSDVLRAFDAAIARVSEGCDLIGIEERPHRV